METIILQEIFYQDQNDCRSHQLLLLNGKEIFDVHDLTDCPEDARIGRSLTGVGRIISLMKLAEGKKIKVKPSIEVSSWEEFENYSRGLPDEEMTLGSMDRF